MKKHIAFSKQLVVISICLLGVMFFSSCKIKGTYPVYTQDLPPGDTAYPKNQVILWRPAGTTAERFNEIVDSLTEQDSSMIVSFCRECGGNLIILQDDDIADGLGPTGQMASTGTGGGIGPTGGSPEVYWSRNFYTYTNDFINEDAERSTNAEEQLNTDSVIVAIFDSGVDPEEVADYNATYHSTSESCLVPEADNGWNFADWNNECRDTYQLPTGHGSNVASIIMDKSAELQQTSVKILPVKFIGDSIPKLFNVLCGLAYASNRGAEIINASFGYYTAIGSDEDVNGTLLFRNFIREYTTERNILVIAAAGNKNDVQEFWTAGTITRSLDSVNFYPASFARNDSIPNIIVATTVANYKKSWYVSPRQNYSAGIVDVGVVADKVQDDSLYLILSPRLGGGNQGYVEGSSFATPVLTGIVATQYRQLKQEFPTSYSQRQVVLNYLLSNELVKSLPEGLKGKIRFGIGEH